MQRRTFFGAVAAGIAALVPLPFRLGSKSSPKAKGGPYDLKQADLTTSSDNLLFEQFDHADGHRAFAAFGFVEGVLKVIAMKLSDGDSREDLERHCRATWIASFETPEVQTIDGGGVDEWWWDAGVNQ